MLLLLAPLMALDYGLRGDGVVQWLVAVVIGVAGLVAAVRGSLIVATMILVVVLAIGGAALRSDLMAAALLCAFASPLFVRRLVEAGLRYVEDEPLYLRCPLLALRSPRDEASLVIGLGQVVQGLGQMVARAVDLALRLLGRLQGAVGLPDELEATAPRWRRALHAVAGFLVLTVVMWLLALVAAWLDQWNPPRLEGLGWAWWAVGGFYFGGLMLLVLLLAVVMVWAIPAMAISLAAGREAFMLPAVTQVEAEPLPYARSGDGERPAAMSLEILYEAHAAGLNHSLYDAPEVRERIAVWLRAQAGVA